mmetsp:Transcript_70919/g.207813  ORF Transcript_70919/g.207813 Transcript_70919/m.207813 type:complete len:303 (+) Transcript_70919:478-1386(+)
MPSGRRPPTPGHRHLPARPRPPNVPEPMLRQLPRAGRCCGCPSACSELREGGQHPPLHHCRSVQQTSYPSFDPVDATARLGGRGFSGSQSEASEHRPHPCRDGSSTWLPRGSLPVVLDQPARQMPPLPLEGTERERANSDRGHRVFAPAILVEPAEGPCHPGPPEWRCRAAPRRRPPGPPAAQPCPQGLALSERSRQPRPVPPQLRHVQRRGRQTATAALARRLSKLHGQQQPGRVPSALQSAALPTPRRRQAPCCRAAAACSPAHPAQQWPGQPRSSHHPGKATLGQTCTQRSSAAQRSQC